VPALDALARWPVGVAAAGVTDADGVREAAGPVDEPLAWASVTKLLTSLAVLVAVEEGTVGLDDPAGPPGATVRHLLAHAAGLGPDGAVLAPPATRRIYSNAGYELLADVVAEAAGLAFATYLGEAVLGPVGLTGTALDGSPAAGAVGPVADLLRLGQELLAPTVVAPATLAEATSVAFPGLVGVLPGFGRQDPNDWGLGPELRDGKAPHWTGSRNSPATFGHFGQAGGFLWVDPEAGLALGCLTDRPFGPWAAEAWPALSDEVVATAAGYRPAMTDPSVPEADAQEQAEAVVPADTPERPRTGVEIPEADAQEQAEPVPADEDEGRD
jgi:CubicO group peptidase (beta-lactamase class C family)